MYGANDVIQELQKEVDDLRKGIRFLSQYAARTHQHWDADEDHKAGKRLAAMAGLLKGYDAQVDVVLAMATTPEMDAAARGRSKLTDEEAAALGINLDSTGKDLKS